MEKTTEPTELNTDEHDFHFSELGEIESFMEEYSDIVVLKCTRWEDTSFDHEFGTYSPPADPIFEEYLVEPHVDEYHVKGHHKTITKTFKVDHNVRDYHNERVDLEVVAEAEIVDYYTIFKIHSNL